MSWKQTRNFNRNITDQAGMCHRLARSGFGIPAGGPNGEAIGSAWAAWSFSKTKHTDRNFPQHLAVPIWFSHYGTYGGVYGNWGHVVVWVPASGNQPAGYISSPGSGHGQRRFGSIAEIETFFRAKYVGWTEDINGRRIIEPVALKPNQRMVNPDATLRVREQPTTKSKELRKLAAGSVHTFAYHVHGEAVKGDKNWLEVPGGGYASVIGFTQKAVTNIPLRPVPVTKTETKTETIPFATERVNNPNLLVGVESVSRTGVNGVRTLTYEVTTLDGKETNRTLKSNTVTVAPISRIIQVGTKRPPVITKETITTTIDLPYETVFEETKELQTGVEQVIRTGVDGKTVTTYEVTYTDGKETSRKQVETLTTPPVTEVVQVGTLQVTTEQEIVVEEIPYGEKRVETSELNIGDEAIQTAGQVGTRVTEYQITYHDGVEVSREQVAGEYTPSVTEVILVGTNTPTDPEPEEPPLDQETPTASYPNWLVALIPLILTFFVSLFTKDDEMPKTDVPLDAPSQVKYPGITTIRTTIQNVGGLLVSGIVGFLTFAAIAPQILESFVDVLSPEVYAWISGIVAGSVALSAAITRVMAIPAVNEWLKKIGLGIPPLD